MQLVKMRLMRLALVPVCLVFLQTHVSAQDNVVNIGVVLPLSGHTSHFGTEALRGINLAVENINSGGGVKGNTLHLVVRDNAGDPATTSQVVSDLLGSQNLLALVGPITSTNSTAAAAVAQGARTPLILPTATSPYVTEIGEYVCRICFTDSYQSKVLTEFSRKRLKADKVAVLFEKGSASSETLASSSPCVLETSEAQSSPRRALSTTPTTFLSWSHRR